MITSTSTQHESTGPAAAYALRRREQQAQETTLQRRHVVLGYLRLLLGLALVVLLWPAVHRAGLFWLWLLVPLVLFIAAAQVHGRVLERLARTRRALSFYDHALARVEDRWSGLQPRTTRVDLSASLYAADLDLFGAGSLFELLCEARTSVGEDTLAAWLLAPAGVTEITARQSAVGDLRGRLGFREQWASAAGPLVANIDRAALACWTGLSINGLPGLMRWLAPLLVVLTWLAGWRYAVAHSPLLLVPLLIVNASLTFFLKARYLPLFSQAQSTAEALRTTHVLLRSMEQEEFTSPLLREMQGKLRSASQSASEAIQGLATLSQWIEARGNYMVRLLDAPFLYSLQLALAVQRWRAQYSGHLDAWLETLGEFEALLSLAAFSYEHPADAFPEIVEGRPAFAAEELGHPLLATAACVRNDISFGGETQLMVISGSNMSGKSTLMRSVGINAVLTFAGAPVRARRLRLTPLTVVASIQVQDSLQQGQSRFFAEILRLRAITQAAHSNGPVLFLLDELLAGTNSQDRLVGAQGLVRELLSTGAIGLLSTHDLALTNVAVEAHLSHHVRNTHFADEIVDGVLRFDYKLREGLVTRSNGVALMRLIGLNV